MMAIHAIDAQLATQAAALRRFSRLYTRLLGTLDEGLLHTELSLTEARVLYELATRKRTQAKILAEDLAIDPGYLSRLLARFQTAGLVLRKRSKHDARATELTLTPVGRRAFGRLNARSEKQARGILQTLPPHARQEVVDALAVLESRLSAGATAPSSITLHSHQPGDMGWVVQSEARVYTREYGWDNTFEALVARIVSDFLIHFNPARERCWIAELAGVPVGHIFLVQHPDEPATAKLRLLLIEPEARGTGLGHTLVAECLAFARAAGYGKVTLWTQSILVAAHRIYQRAGFQVVREDPHHSFGQDLIGQTWELDL